MGKFVNYYDLKLVLEFNYLIPVTVSVPQCIEFSFAKKSSSHKYFRFPAYHSRKCLVNFLDTSMINIMSP
jgi:hypothetical protein